MKKQDDNESQSSRSVQNQQTEHSSRIIHDISADNNAESQSQRLPLWTNNPSMVSAFNEPQRILTNESHVTISNTRDKFAQPKPEIADNYETDFSISGSYDQFADLKFTRAAVNNQVSVLEGIKQIRVNSQPARGDSDVINMPYNQESLSYLAKQDGVTAQTYGDYGANIETPQANTPVIKSLSNSYLQHSPFGDEPEDVPSPTKQLRF